MPENQIPQNQPEPAAPKPKFTIPRLTNFEDFINKIKLQKRKIILAVSIVLTLTILFLVISLAIRFMMQRNQEDPGIQEIGTEDGNGAPAEEALSPYGKDEKVLSLKEENENLEKDLSSTSLREDTLRIPLLDFNIKF